MDQRIIEHADVLVDWSARVERGDNVIVSVAEGTHDLAVAVAEKLGDRGANMITLYDSDELSSAYLSAHDGTFDHAGAHEQRLLEKADVYLRLGGGRNTAETSDIPQSVRQAYNKSRTDAREARMNTDWVSTVHPTRSLAQQAGMSYSAYKTFVYNAILRDWESLAEEMAEMKTLLDAGSEVHITTDRTDLTMSIADRTAVNSCASVAYDSHNLPSGEVFTAPYATTGTAFFDVPMTIDGTRVQDVELVFADGAVVDYSAVQGEETLSGVLETDDGARRLGELGIGMNRGIDRFTDNILFDEKMGDTVHLAVGRAYDACLPTGETGNKSAVHVDMIMDMSSNSTLSIDGEVIQRDGTFRWEDGFEA
ncbi:aminopeptidase [Halorubraceae archaeon YAN]|nr:aminopeptidase [Halorubraceae archaeon YAN]